MAGRQNTRWEALWEEKGEKSQDWVKEEQEREREREKRKIE